MKTILAILLTLGAFTSNAMDDMRYKSAFEYTIVSDTYTNDMLSGQVRVKGNVLNGAGTALAGVMVSTIDERIAAYTNSAGAYEMIIHDSDTALFIFIDGYKEVAMNRYDFREGHTVVIDFIPSVLPQPDGPEPYPEIISYKPVIYLYSTKSMEVSIALDYLGALTFTYPEYNEGWNVNVDENGIHTANNEKSYPYLFWEGEMEGLTYETKADKLVGQLVATDTLVQYLESQLTAIGLNRTEQTDFITFWAPRMIGKDYVFVQFLVDNLYTDKVAALTVNPQPESMKRVYLLYTVLDEKPQMEYTPQVFEPFNREGFTLIEWGGSNIDITEINL